MQILTQSTQTKRTIDDLGNLHMYYVYMSSDGPQKRDNQF